MQNSCAGKVNKAEAGMHGANQYGAGMHGGAKAEKEMRGR